jgi:DNA repair protein RecN (Recombination protein N)
MIQSISIRNIALIDRLTIFFHSGLQVLSGETGAGKSIVVDAMKLILGGRADRTLIRSGCEKGSVEAVFDVPGAGAAARLLERESLDFDGSSITVYREISAGGKNICRINGIMMPLSFLKELSPMLMNLHGQSEHQFLADPETHLSYLDHLGDNSHTALLGDVRESCIRFMGNHREYARLVKASRDKEPRILQITRELEEIRSAALQPGEEESLRHDLRNLEKAGRISGILKSAYSHLVRGDAEEGGALPAVREAGNSLKAITEDDDLIRGLSARCENLYYELEDIAFQLSGLIEKNDFDPVRLEQTENRLDQIRRIEKKYGASADEVLQTEESLSAELDDLNRLDDRLEQLGAEHKRLLAEYRDAARRLSASRKALADRFSDHMMQELQQLGMANTVFRVRFEENPDGKPKMPTETGDDRGEFLICPNPGEPLMPLKDIASGGELSRLMLAMKTLEAGHTGVDCMIFDEIDTGISGKMAQTVAEKMIAISRYHQVICVSHLPQLAAAGDYQYLVSKGGVNGRTETSVSELDREGRIQEIARIISGADGISPNAVTYAEQLLAAADHKKKGLP